MSGSSPVADVIVLGLGGFGSSTCHHLARRGARVIGLEQFSLGHPFGSSHGESRIIRLAYFEHQDYVPLLRRAYELWHDLEQVSGRSLLRPTRLLLAGPATGETISGARRAAAEHGLAVDQLTPHEAGREFPGLHVPESFSVLLEPDAGVLWVEDCVQSSLDEARRLGAELHDQEPVIDWSADDRGVTVRTVRHTYRADKLVITAGAWAAGVLRDLSWPLTVLRKFVGWFPCAGAYAAAEGYPTFYVEQPDGAFYGFPSFDGQTLKVAEHTGRELVIDPGQVDRGCRPDDVARLRSFLAAVLPRAGLSPVRHSVCLYTMSPDGHFVVDQDPRHRNVVFAAGFSGHGFKFASVLGEVLADLALTGRTAAPIEFLQLQRFASR